MAIYHLSVKTFSRSKGQSATAAIAYRAGAKIKCEHEGRTHDYTKKNDVLHSEIFLPANAPSWATDREQLWNEVEKAEKRKNSTIAREFEVALPNELNEAQRIELVQDFAQQIVARHGCAVDAHLHNGQNMYESKENHHAHIMLSTRQLEQDGFTKKTRELDEKKSGEVVYWREQWAKTANEHLREYGIEIDHRSLKDQGLEREPTIKLGVAASALERKGTKTDRGDINREVAKYNKVIKTNNNDKINDFRKVQIKHATEFYNKVWHTKKELPKHKRKIAERFPKLYQAFDDLGIPTAEPEPIRSVKHEQERERIEPVSERMDRPPSVESHSNERGRELPPVGSVKSNELGQGHNSEVQPADQTSTSTAPRDIVERPQLPLEPYKRPQATQTSLQPNKQTVEAKRKELAQQMEGTTESPEQEAIRANIEGARRVVSEVYANEPEKRKKMLKAIDDKIPDIMSGKVVLPPIEIKTTPERVAVRTPKPNKDQDIER